MPFVDLALFLGLRARQVAGNRICSSRGPPAAKTPRQTRAWLEGGVSWWDSGRRLTSTTEAWPTPGAALDVFCPLGDAADNFGFAPHLKQPFWPPVASCLHPLLVYTISPRARLSKLPQNQVHTLVWASPVHVRGCRSFGGVTTGGLDRTLLPASLASDADA